VQNAGDNEVADPAQAPRLGVRLMIIILVATALVAIYANVQKFRRAQIEKVTIIPVPTATPAPLTSGN
jgi:hypothetical protein